MTTATAPTTTGPTITRRHVATAWVAEITDRNGSTMWTTFDGRLTRDMDEAERFVTREMAELMADPSMNGIPASNIRRLNIRGEAVPVEWA